LLPIQTISEGLAIARWTCGGVLTLAVSVSACARAAAGHASDARPAVAASAASTAPAAPTIEPWARPPVPVWRPPSIIRLEHVANADGTHTLWASITPGTVRLALATYSDPFYCAAGYSGVGAVGYSGNPRAGVDVFCTPDLSKPAAQLLLLSDGLQVTTMQGDSQFPEISDASTYELPAPPGPAACAAPPSKTVAVRFDRRRTENHSNDLGWVAQPLRWRTCVSAPFGDAINCGGVSAADHRSGTEGCSSFENGVGMGVSYTQGLLRWETRYNGPSARETVVGYVFLPCDVDVRVFMSTFRDPHYQSIGGQ
jgi:hypothetical protein